MSGKVGALRVFEHHCVINPDFKEQSCKTLCFSNQLQDRNRNFLLGRSRWSYLQNNRDRIHYRSQRQAGYPLGSGGIESAHKFICHARLKRSGAWWYVANSNHMLALRCAKYNGTFERVFARYQQNMLEQSQQKNVKK